MLYRTILCASDGLEHSERALRRAAEIAADSRAELHVVNVPEVEPTLAMARASDDVEDVQAERRQAIRSEIEAIGARNPELLIVPHMLHGRTGSTADRIVQLAERIDADLIVVGSRRRSALGLAIPGSTSRRLMRATRRSVLVLAGHEAGRIAARRRVGARPGPAWR